MNLCLPRLLPRLRQQLPAALVASAAFLLAACSEDDQVHRQMQQLRSDIEGEQKKAKAAEARVAELEGQLANAPKAEPAKDHSQEIAAAVQAAVTPLQSRIQTLEKDLTDARAKITTAEAAVTAANLAVTQASQSAAMPTASAPATPPTVPSAPATPVAATPPPSAPAQPPADVAEQTATRQRELVAAVNALNGQFQQQYTDVSVQEITVKKLRAPESAASPYQSAIVFAIVSQSGRLIRMEFPVQAQPNQKWQIPTAADVRRSFVETTSNPAVATRPAAPPTTTTVPSSNPERSFQQVDGNTYKINWNDQPSAAPATASAPAPAPAPATGGFVPAAPPATAAAPMPAPAPVAPPAAAPPAPRKTPAPVMPVTQDIIVRFE